MCGNFKAFDVTRPKLCLKCSQDTRFPMLDFRISVCNFLYNDERVVKGVELIHMNLLFVNRHIYIYIRI